MSKDEEPEGESIISLAEKKKKLEQEKALDRLVDIGGVLLDPITGCWLWKGRCDAKGYARSGSELAYRKAFVIMEGRSIPPGVEMDHICRRPGCIRPAHLDPVTRAENLRRKGIESRVPVRCPIGHTMASPMEHGRTPEGGAYCRNCVEPTSKEDGVMEWLDSLV